MVFTRNRTAPSRAHALSYWLFCVTVALIGFSAILMATCRYGIGLSPDSVGYISAARNLLAGKGATLFNGQPLVYQPPLYPLVLAAFSFCTGLDPLCSARIVNAAAFAAILLLTGGLLAYRFRIAILPAVFGVLFTLSGPLLGVSLRAWSEPLFICLVLAFLWRAEAYAAHPRMLPLLLLALVVGLASLTRYIGAIMIPAGIFAVSSAPASSATQRIRRALMFATLAALPLTFWLARNLFLCDTLFGERGPSSETLPSNLLRIVNGIWLWYRPPSIILNHLSSLPGKLLAGCGGLILLLTLVRRGLYRQFWRQAGFWRLVILVVLYLGFLAISASVTAYDHINFRLLSPIFVPLLLLLLFILDRSLERKTWTVSRKNAFGIIPVVVFAILLARPLYGSIHVLKRMYRQGYGYSGRAWNKDRLVEFVRKHAPELREAALYSNSLEALYLFCGITTCRPSPRSRLYNSPLRVTRLTDLRGSWPPEGRALLVWFNRQRRKHLFCVDDLKRIADFTELFRCRDGALYAVTAKSGRTTCAE